MKDGKRIAKLFAAAWLFMALMVPTVIQFAHLFDVHEHLTCTDQKSHVHQTQVECELCSVHLSAFHPAFSGSVDLDNLVFDLDKKIVFKNQLNTDKILKNNQHRGPPLT